MFSVAWGWIDTSSRETIHTKDESKRGSAFAFASK